MCEKKMKRKENLSFGTLRFEIRCFLGLQRSCENHGQLRGVGKNEQNIHTIISLVPSVTFNFRYRQVCSELCEAVGAHGSLEVSFQNNLS